MQITPAELQRLWQGLNIIYSKEDTEFDGVFDYFMQKQNIPIIQKEVEKLQGVDEDVWDKIKDQPLDLPLQSVDAEALPKGVQRGVVMLLDPVINGEFEPDAYQSQVDSLIEEAQADEDTDEEE